MRRGAVIAAALVTLASCRDPQPPSPDATWSYARCSPAGLARDSARIRIDALLSRWAEREAVPGLAAGIVCGDALVWSAGYGVRGPEDPTPIAPPTRFRIASLTKLLTGTAILQLRDAGLLDLDDPIRRHLPWFTIRRTETTGDAPITIRHLLTHTSGLPRDSRLTDRRRRTQPPRDAAMAALPSQTLEAPPGTRYAPSDLGYALLGEIVTALGGRSFPQVITDSILTPLGMSNTRVDPSVADTFVMPRPRDSGPGEGSEFRDMGYAIPAGGLVSSVEDLSRFVLAHLSPYRGETTSALSDSSLFAMHRVYFNRDSVQGVGLGWLVDTTENQHVVSHGGDTAVDNAYLVIDLSRAIGVIVLTSVQGVDIAEPAVAILDLTRRAMVP